jgi:phospholipid/cholesterol/gamma-HCH transport system permease protein
MNKTPANEATITIDSSNNQINLSGSWSIQNIRSLSSHYTKESWPKDATITLNGDAITKMDSAGAWLLNQCLQLLKKNNSTFELTQFHPEHTEMLKLVEPDIEAINKSKPPQKEKKGFIYTLGKETCARSEEALKFLSLIGELWLLVIKGVQSLRVFHIPNICNAIYHTGYRALPILAMLSFLIGVVLAYQMGLQLETYGANIFIVYLTGVAILREFGPLIAAIIVAGRTSSSFTAEIGTMKVNEEIDALMTMGISPVQRLVLPKTLGLIIVFPLLIFWADLFGIIGSMVMSKVMLGISYPDFFQRLKTDVGSTHYYIGLSKAPFFASIIALVGCYQGFAVTFSSDSVGFQTTKSVVQAIFLIIIADAFFSVLYSWFDL